MQEDNKLRQVAKDIGEEIVAGTEEIPLNQPFPEQLKDSSDNKPSDENTSDESNAVKETKDESDSTNLNGEESEQNDKDEATSKPIIAKTKHAENKLVVLLVTIGIAICIIGIILLILVSLLSGLVVIAVGVSTILFCVLSPPGY